MVEPHKKIGSDKISPLYSPNLSMFCHVGSYGHYASNSTRNKEVLVAGRKN